MHELTPMDAADFRAADYGARRYWPWLRRIAPEDWRQTIWLALLTARQSDYSLAGIRRAKMARKGVTCRIVESFSGAS